MDEKSKNKLVEQEKEILAQWEKNGIFEKILQKESPKGEFVFYEGPPTANGRPGIHHLEARAFKDVVPRYKTMRGYHVRRKGGWDTHGLPVEIQVEKELGLKSKKEIEQYGIAAFNEKCKESVWKYVHEWEDFTLRSGYWVDLKNPYITYRSPYIESLWNIVKKVSDRGLLYKDYKVVPWCPRCQTGLSSHELAQGYEDVKDLSVYVKFECVEKPNSFLLAWTTTPWTLPGNVALAVGETIEYVEVQTTENGETLILAKERLSALKDTTYEVRRTYLGKDLIGLHYKPLFPFLKENISGPEKEKFSNAYKVYKADFVTTEDGTGIVHTAVMYGQDDFELGTKIGLPKFHLVNDDGTFKKEAGFLAGMFVKDEATDVAIIKDLAGRNLLLAKEKYQHSYPFCWRCKTPLIYFARDSWYIKMSALRSELVKQNEKIHWEPEHIKEGRFGEWLREVKDWAISRERFWGTPLPVWVCKKCSAQKVISSVKDLERKPRNQFFVVRHGESENNVANTLNSDVATPFHLTDHGKEESKKAGEKLRKQKIDVIFSSPFIRTRETAEIIADTLGYPKEKIIYDDRLREISFGVFEGKVLDEYLDFFKSSSREEVFKHAPEGGENRQETKNRTGEFLREIDGTYGGKRIAVISHEGVIWAMSSAAKGLDVRQTLLTKKKGEEFIKNAEVMELTYKQIPRNKNFELDLHRPYIDSVTFSCTCGGEMVRVKEVMDVWFDSGAMPFAQDHYPFDFPKKLFGGKKLSYPADFISEAIDQTRGWFYTLHAIGVLMGKGSAYKNVVCLGHILDAEGKKMSKSIGNVVDPFLAMEKYGADPLRFWMYSVNQPGESKNFDERTVDDVVKKVFNLLSNVLSFYLLYASDLKAISHKLKATHILDLWIVARLAQLTKEVTDGLERYKFFEPTRAIRDFIADLSQWYVRRSRERMKGIMSNDLGMREGAEAALITTRYVLLELSKLMAPFTPFFAESLYRGVGGEKESVHLEDWPKGGSVNEGILRDMEEVRKEVSSALEARAKANIKVRQPLSKLQVESRVLQGKGELLALVRDEVNVKEITFGGKLVLDTTITPELREEGELREAIRAIQELRKEKGLKPGELAILSTSSKVSETGLVKKFEAEIKKTASLSEIKHGNSSEDYILE